MRIFHAAVEVPATFLTTPVGREDTCDMIEIWLIGARKASSHVAELAAYFMSF
jgi:hypothetical protein